METSPSPIRFRSSGGHLRGSFFKHWLSASQISCAGASVLAFGDPDRSQRAPRRRDLVSLTDTPGPGCSMRMSASSKVWSNLGWIAATPDGGKSKQADKIVNAPLKALDLAGSKCSGCTSMFNQRLISSSLPRTDSDGRARSPARRRCRTSSQELLRRHEERIPVQQATDDDHRMRPHDVDHRVTPKFAELVGADDRVVVADATRHSRAIRTRPRSST